MDRQDRRTVKASPDPMRQRAREQLHEGKRIVFGKHFAFGHTTIAGEPFSQRILPVPPVWPERPRLVDFAHPSTVPASEAAVHRLVQQMAVPDIGQ